MAQVVHIEGLDDCLRCLDQAPANAVKMTQTALREASKKAARSIRQKTPQRFRRLVKYKVFKGQVTQNTNALVGLFNKKQVKNGSGQVADWFKAYWKNYGTLTHRDREHTFDTPVKRHVARRRNNVGQPAEKFFETAIAGWEGPFMEAFEQSMVEQQEKLYDR